MVKTIIRDTMLLMKKSHPASKTDIQTARDLVDTLKANSHRCVGLAANMIGVHKNIIAVMILSVPVAMINPRMISHSAESYEVDEGCLSLDGTRKTTRYNTVEIEYYDLMMKKHRNTYSGFTAEIIQHELDHCNGIII